ncbi:MAG: beta-lactamase family protein [Candidatus Latescibacterota bacterium]|nr:MAG: beta-lactamase family protein [Candidatus Latescibacterota bacterium]
MKKCCLAVLGFLLINVTIAFGDCGDAAREAFGQKGTVELPSSDDRLDTVIQDLPQKIEAWVERTRHASVSLAIVHGREIIYSQAFGFADLEKQIPATKETIYPLASITKVFTATMLAQLCEKGVVDLETPLNKYIPEYNVKSRFAAVRPTTLRQLASHTSGLPKDAPNNFWHGYSAFGFIVTGGQADLADFVSKDEVLESLEFIELEFPPDIYSHYSNLGFQLLGMALEKAAGVPFAEYLETNILQPLGMGKSGFTFDDADSSRMTVGYVCTGPEAPFLQTPRWMPGCALYSGGLYATAEDLARFVSLQFQDATEKGGQILSTGMLRRMRSPNSVRRPGARDSYGLGWGVVRIADYDAIEHNGALVGHGAHVSAIPELELGIVVLSNSRNHMWSAGGCKHLARELYPDLITAIGPAEADESVQRETLDLSPYEGRFVLPGGYANIELTKADGRLMMSIIEDPSFDQPMIPLNPYEFCFEEDPARTPILFFQANDERGVETVSFLSYVFRRATRDPSE